MLFNTIYKALDWATSLQFGPQCYSFDPEKCSLIKVTLLFIQTLQSDKRKPFSMMIELELREWWYAVEFQKIKCVDTMPFRLKSFLSRSVKQFEFDQYQIEVTLKSLFEITLLTITSGGFE